LNCQFGSFPITYLGVPLRPHKLLHEDWQSLCRPKLIKDLQGWKGNTVSRGGRLILINSVLSSMSSYMMSFHNFLYGSLSRWIKWDGIFLFFLGKGRGGTSPCDCLVKWAEVCQPKLQWGLGVLNHRLMYKALLGRCFGSTLISQTCFGDSWVYVLQGYTYSL